MDNVQSVLSITYDAAEFIIEDLYIVELDNEKRLFKATENKLYDGIINRIETKYVGEPGFLMILTEGVEGYTTHIVYTTGEHLVETNLFLYNFSLNGLDIFISHVGHGTYSKMIVIKQETKEILTRRTVDYIGILTSNKDCICFNEKRVKGGQNMMIIAKDHSINKFELKVEHGEKRE